MAWSGDATFRYWTMLFGLGGWVPTGRGWIEKWNTDFEWHRISDVSRDIRSMAEDWKVNLQFWIYKVDTKNKSNQTSCL